MRSLLSEIDFQLSIVAQAHKTLNESALTYTNPTQPNHLLLKMALDLKRFPGFAYGLAYNGLVTLISPLWTSECEFFEEEEKRKYMRNLQNEFIEATKET